MKIISCSIENFGKLQNCTFHFNDGKNIIMEDNGFGKSTLASFIRTMFFGLEGLKSHSDETNEARRYFPWQGGIFGGRIDFEVNGKQYALTRHFDKKGATEFFELRDASTNLISTDFGENIGEEVFAINRESFLRSVFIGQDDLYTEATDFIHGKIGGNKDNTGDLTLFEAANQALEERMNKLTPKRATGYLNKTKVQIDELNKELLQKSSVETDYQAKKESLDQEKEKLASLKQAELELQDLQKAAAEEKARIEIENQRAQKKEKIDALKATIAEKEQEFGITIPDKEVIKSQMVVSNQLTAAKREAQAVFSIQDEQRLNSLATLFTGGMPTDGELAVYESLAKKNSDLEKEYAENKLSEIERKTLETAQARIERKEKAIADKKKELENSKKFKFSALVYICCSVVFTLLGLFSKDAFQIIFLAVAVIGLFAAIFLFTKANASAINNLAEMEEDLQEEKERFETVIEKSSRIDEKEMQAAIEENRHKLDNFLNMYHSPSLDGQYLSDVHRLKTMKSAYQMYAERKEKGEESQKKVANIEKKLAKFFKALQKEPVDDYATALEALLEKRISLENTNENLIAAKEELNAFDEKYPIKKMAKGADKLPSLEEVNEKIEESREAQRMTATTISAYEKSLESLATQLDELSEKEEMLAQLQASFQENKQLFDDTKIAKEMMEKAKDALTNRFAKPIYDAFCKYFTMITNNLGIAVPSDFQIDAKANVTITASGIQRNISAFSKGYQDLIHLCMRFAYIEAMYPNEKPAVFLDDPFTNLDTEKVKQATAFLDEISKYYQVIYFTCHESRR